MNDDPFRRRPTFLGIGTFKAATTWLHGALEQREDVYMPAFKEVHFFTRRTFLDQDMWSSHGLEWYEKLFADGLDRPARGEISPGYLSDPDAAERIARTMPEVRLIAFLRQPAERAWSHYWFRRGKSRVSYEFDELVQRPGFDPDGFIRMGRYGEHLEAYHRHFRPEQLLVRLLEDVRADPERLWTEVCEHIGIPVDPIPEAVHQRTNPSRTRRSRLVYDAKRQLSGALVSSGLIRLHRSLKRTGIPQLIDRLNDRPGKNPSFPPDLRAELTRAYEPDLQRLEAILDRDLSHWR